MRAGANIHSRAPIASAATAVRSRLPDRGCARSTSCRPSRSAPRDRTASANRPSSTASSPGERPLRMFHVAMRTGPLCPSGGGLASWRADVRRGAASRRRPRPPRRLPRRAAGRRGLPLDAARAPARDAGLPRRGAGPGAGRPGGAARARGQASDGVRGRAGRRRCVPERRACPRALDGRGPVGPGAYRDRAAGDGRAGGGLEGRGGGRRRAVHATRHGRPAPAPSRDDVVGAAPRHLPRAGVDGGVGRPGRLVPRRRAGQPAALRNCRVVPTRVTP